MAQKVSVVIPTYQRTESLKRLLDSLRQSFYQNLEIIVVNDGGDLSPGDLEKYDLIFIDNKTNQGLAFSRNRGAEKAFGEYVLFVDDDNLVEKNMISQLVCSLDHHKNLVAIGPLTFYLSAPKKIWFMGSRISLTTSKPFFYREVVKERLVDKNLFWVENLHNCFMVRRSVGEEVGWFDEKMFMSGTEFDLFSRIKKLRLNSFLAVDLKAHCYHDVPPRRKNLLRSLGFSYPQRAYFFQRNRALLVGRYGNFFQKLLFAVFFYPLFLLGYTAFFVCERRLDLLFYHLRGTVAGYCYLLKGF